jgi:hypothetical protein
MRFTPGRNSCPTAEKGGEQQNEENAKHENAVYCGRISSARVNDLKNAGFTASFNRKTPDPQNHTPKANSFRPRKDFPASKAVSFAREKRFPVVM